MALRWDDRFAHRTHHMTSSAIRELLKITERPGFISFAGGLPAPEVFPVDEISAVSARILQDAGPQALQYSPTEGFGPLRALLAEHLSEAGCTVTPDHVLITTGSQQAIDLVGKILLDPGDAVAVESPTYLAALQAWNAYEARFLGIESDDQGMRTDQLNDLLPHRPKLVYCLPNFQNPKGVTLSLERRRQLVDFSMAHGVPVLEDDPYRDLRFEGEDLPRLLTLAAQGSRDTAYAGNIISLGSFSKILSPGLRVGWVVAAPQVIAQLVQAKQGTDLHTATFNQMIAYEMLRSGFLARHQRTIVNVYRDRRDVMLAALDQHFPAGTHWTQPSGGMFLWVDLPGAIDTADLLREAMEFRVAFVPGQGFHVDGGGTHTMRLNFSNSSPDQIREGIRRLGEALRHVRFMPEAKQLTGSLAG